MILVLDNYDSFTYNLVQYIGEILLQSDKAPEAGAAVGLVGPVGPVRPVGPAGQAVSQIEVIRNDQATVEEIAARGYEKIILSPGPCTPQEAGILCDLIRRMAGVAPMLGVCLGHQGIGHVFGGDVVRAKEVVHGKTSLVRHNGQTIFRGVSNPMVATRYHSLVIDRATMPECLEITAWTDDGVVMGVKHRTLPVWGVQFHPESILTVDGKKLLRNFLEQ
ncbi:MAG: aminodeoxychorismate/anthranilate synthase component II [Candidatus Sumerlaeota bacterium]|nr:aminodeoxychorismate/anthranilate synthase component II [Candidatus Sumerlaeota bacterium]